MVFGNICRVAISEAQQQSSTAYLLSWQRPIQEIQADEQGFSEIERTARQLWHTTLCLKVAANVSIRQAKREAYLQRQNLDDDRVSAMLQMRDCLSYLPERVHELLLL